MEISSRAADIYLQHGMNPKTYKIFLISYGFASSSSSQILSLIQAKPKAWGWLRVFSCAHCASSLYCNIWILSMQITCVISIYFIRHMPSHAKYTLHGKLLLSFIRHISLSVRLHIYSLYDYFYIAAAVAAAVFRGLPPVWWACSCHMNKNEFSWFCGFKKSRHLFGMPTSSMFLLCVNGNPCGVFRRTNEIDRINMAYHNTKKKRQQIPIPF